VLDSPSPRIPFREYAYQELRYKMLTRTNPAEAELLMDMAQKEVNLKWRQYERAGFQGRERRVSDDARTRDAKDAT
jgi:pyruvate-ferredoxin/flavodoxin oxidoreductase